MNNGDQQYSAAKSASTRLQLRLLAVCVSLLFGAQAVYSCSNTITFSVSSTAETCAANDGTASVTPAGGTAPYTFEWDGLADGQATASATGLTSGTYDVTISDAGGCTAVATATVDPASNSIPTSQLAAWSCGKVLTSLNSYIYGNMVPGAQRYEYRFHNPATGFVSSGFSHSSYPYATFFAAVWVPGIQINTTYEVQVRAKVGGCWGAFGPVCALTTPIVIPETQLTSASCGSTLNTINDYFYIDPVAGASRYEYEISDGNGFTTTVQSLNAYPTASWFSLYYASGIRCNTTYSIRIRAQLFGTWGNWGPACDLSTPINDPNLSGLTLQAANITEALCNGATASIALSTTGGNAPLAYSWDAAAGSQMASTAVGLSSGDYEVTVTDILGCAAVETYTVETVAGPAVTASTTNRTCNAVADGTATLAATGGAAPYTYTWDVAAGSQATATANGLSNGNYNATVTDGNGCTTVATAIVGLNDLSTLNTSSTDESCTPGTDGTATVGPTDGTAPYTYTWAATAGNQTAATAAGLAAGGYDVTVVDATGCENSTTVGVALTPGVGLLVGTTDAVCEWGDGSASTNTIGGTSPFSFLWDTNAGSQTTSTATGLDAGNYDVTVVDGHGCETYSTASVGTTCVEAFTTDKADGGWDHSLMVCANGLVWASGDNTHGQLGDGNSGANLNSSTPVQVAGLDQVRAVSVGQEHSVALREDGSVWAWGLNDAGQLGTGLGGQSATPVMITGLANIIDVAAGDYHTLALDENGTVWGWGNNGNGQVGNGTNVQAATPVHITGLSNVIAIAAGSGHSMALLDDGTIWAWGHNGAGQLGTNSFSSQQSPVQVTGIDKVKAIACGGLHSLAVRGDGTVWAWGSNSTGQLGDGTYNLRLTPVQSSIANVVSVAAGNSNSRALKADGSVWSWGYTYAGSGGGTTPLIETSLSAVAEIGAGDQFVMAVTNGGDVVAFGYNGNGPLGIGNTTTNYPTLGVSELGCSMVPDCGLMEVESMESTNEVCFNAGDGTATAFGDGGIAPYAYSWDAAAGNQQTQLAEGLVPGSYKVTVTDFQGCTAVDSVSLGAGVVVPTTGLQSNSCGVTLANLNSYIHVQAVPGATRYQYEFSDGNGFVSEAYSLSQYPSATFFSPYYVPNLQAGITYNVRVRAQVNGCWGDYGSSCSVTSPATVPQVQVSSAWCGATLSSINQYFYISGSGAASRYQYEVSDGNGFVGTGFSPSSHPTATWFSLYFVAGIQPGTTYDVRVRTKVAGVWGTYGPSCQLTTPASSSKYAAESATVYTLPAHDALVVQLQPNPSNGAVALMIAGMEEQGTVTVHDLSGRMLHQQTVGGTQATVRLNTRADLASGMYLVSVASGSKLQQLRMVIR